MQKILYWLPPFISALLVIGDTMLNFAGSEYLTYAAFIILFLGVILTNISIYKRENSKPIIKLLDFGFDIKELGSGHPPAVCAFMIVNNQPKKDSLNDVGSTGVNPTVRWIDEHGDSDNPNRGRWFYTSDEQKRMMDSELLTANLDANGMPRKLHFSYTVSKDWQIQSLWRTESNKIETRKKGSAQGYTIEINLKDKQLSDVAFYFKIARTSTSYYPEYELRLDRLDRKDGKVMDTKKFDLKKLHEFEKEKGLINGKD